MDRDNLLQGFFFENIQGIACVRKEKEEAIGVAEELLYRASDNKTCLFLSGGSTPRPLYERLAIQGKLRVGALAMIDERYGKKLHENSNERMINEAYLSNLTKSFYPILKNANEEDISIEQTTFDYDETLRYLFNYFPKTIGILGIGEDGHTAGIPAIQSIAREIENDKSAYVFSYDDGGKYGKRITMTYNSLSRLDLVFVLAFGKEKRKPLRNLLKEGELSKSPSRFFLGEEISGKCVLLTDQQF